MLQEADREQYVVTCAVDSNVRCNPQTIKDFGLCDFHSYTLMQAVPVRLYEGSNQLRYLCQLRNPWGSKEWIGPWSDSSVVWDKYPYVEQQLNQRIEERSASAMDGTSDHLSSNQFVLKKAKAGDTDNNDDGEFWILFKDFFAFFHSITINYTRADFHHVHVSD